MASPDPLPSEFTYYFLLPWPNNIAENYVTSYWQASTFADADCTVVGGKISTSIKPIILTNDRTFSTVKLDNYITFDVDGFGTITMNANGQAPFYGPPDNISNPKWSFIGTAQNNTGNSHSAIFNMEVLSWSTYSLIKATVLI